MKKITFITLHLGYGGVENALTTLSNSLTNNYEVEIVSVYKRTDSPVFKLDKNIKLTYLINHADMKFRHEKNPIKKLFYKIYDNIIEKKLVKKQMKKCDSDIIISTNLKYNNSMNKFCNKNTTKIFWEHTDPERNKKYIKNVIKSVKNLDYFVLVSKYLQEFYLEKIHNNKCRCIYIPNALESIPDSNLKKDNKSIVTIGKLSKEKGYVDLIEIFKYVSLKCPDWQLNVIGDGVERDNILDRIKVYKLENNVILHGFKDKKFINKMLEKSSIYVASSLTDAFGMPILEAFSYGLPCVAFSASPGASEIISNNWDGYLIDNLDKEKMAKKIIDLIKNENRRIVMGNNAIKKSLKYSIDIIKEKWLEILN